MWHGYSQVFRGVEQQQGAKGADVPGEAAKAFFCIILLVHCGACTHWEVLQLLLQKDRDQLAKHDPGMAQPPSHMLWLSFQVTAGHPQNSMAGGMDRMTLWARSCPQAVCVWHLYTTPFSTARAVVVHLHVPARAVVVHLHVAGVMTPICNRDSLCHCPVSPTAFTGLGWEWGEESVLKPGEGAGRGRSRLGRACARWFCKARGICRSFQL